MSSISADLDAAVEVSALIDDRAVTSVFQSVVDLETGAVVGYEALSRGPADSRWHDPVELFCAATALGRVGELDWICRASAYRAAMAAGLDRSVMLFVNAEPTAMGLACPEELRSVIIAGNTTLRVLTDLTERAVARSRVAVLDAARICRGYGWGVALDDAGVDPDALTLINSVGADVVKLDPYLLGRMRRPETAAVVWSLVAAARSAGATVLTEGIETEAQAKIAISVGARLAQGRLFGAPTPLA